MAKQREIKLEHEAGLKPLELAQAARRRADETEDPSLRGSYMRLFSRLFGDWKRVADRERAI